MKWVRKPVKENSRVMGQLVQITQSLQMAQKFIIIAFPNMKKQKTKKTAILLITMI